jgi:hypothetical protein
VRAESELELPVQLLDLMQRDLILASVLLLTRDRLTLDDLAHQDFITDEDVHRVSEARTRGRGD